MKEYFSKDSYLAKENTILDTIDLTPFLDSRKIKDAFINVGAWQSWNPGFVFPESKFKPSKKIVLSSFLSYLRFDDFYLLLMSVGNISNKLPPLQFIIDRKTAKVTLEIADKGKNWKKGELQAQI